MNVWMNEWMMDEWRLYTNTSDQYKRSILRGPFIQWELSGLIAKQIHIWRINRLKRIRMRKLLVLLMRISQGERKEAYRTKENYKSVHGCYGNLQRQKDTDSHYIDLTKLIRFPFLLFSYLLLLISLFFYFLFFVCLCIIMLNLKENRMKHIHVLINYMPLSQCQLVVTI